MASIFRVRNAVGALLTLSLAVGCGDNADTGDLDLGEGSDIELPGDNENGPGTEPGLFIPNPGPGAPLPGRFVSDAGGVISGPIEGEFGIIFAVESPTGSIIRQTDNGGGSSDILVEVPHAVNRLTADAAGIFWLSAHGDAVHGYEWGEGQAENLYPTTGATSLAIDNNQIYFGTADGQVFAAGRAGGSAPVLIASVTGLVNNAVRAGDYLYFTTLSTDGGALYRAHVAKDSVEPLVNGFNFDSGIIVDDEHVFWGDSSLRAVMRVWNSGGEAVSVATGQYQISALTSERFNLFFATASDGTIKSVPKLGGEVSPLAIEESYVDYIQLIDNRLFWTNEGPAGIMVLDI